MERIEYSIFPELLRIYGKHAITVGFISIPYIQVPRFLLARTLTREDLAILNQGNFIIQLKDRDCVYFNSTLP